MWQSRCVRPAIVGLQLLALLPALGSASAFAQSLNPADETVEQAAMPPDLFAPTSAVLIVVAPNPGYAPAPPADFDGWDKASFYLHRAFSFGTAFGPAVEAATVMAYPPKTYPNEWRQGAGAYARNYGAVLGRVQTAELSRFAAGVALREDPRYYPSTNRAVGARIVHAIWFTLADRSDSGHSRVAFANLIGAVSGGFVGNSYLPAGYTDLSHVGIRTGVQMGGFAIDNGFAEFMPELNQLTRVLTSHLRRHD